MKLKLVKQFDDDNVTLQFVTLSLHVDEKYNYTQCYVDDIKINDDVKNAFRGEISREYKSSKIYKNLKGVKWNVNHVALDVAGDLTIILKTMHNVNREFFNVNRNSRMLDVKEAWEN